MKTARRQARWMAVTTALLCVLLMLGALCLRRNPLELFRLIGSHILLDPYGLGEILYRATTLIFTGLACALAFRCGLFTIGAEGQVYAGAFAMTVFGLRFPNLSAPLLLPSMLCVAALAGAAWAWIPAWLKARRGAHEVITTMMMNFVALALVNYLISTRFHEPETIHTAELPAASALPSLETLLHLFPGSNANASLLLALVLIAAVAYMLKRTPLGFEWRAVGLSPSAARACGINVDKAWFRILLASGAIAGLAGANFVLGDKHYFEQGFASGAGYLGVAVALVARNNPFGIIPSALLFAFLSQSGLVLNRVVPRELFEILQAAAILIVVISQNVWGGEERT